MSINHISEQTLDNRNLKSMHRTSDRYRYKKSLGKYHGFYAGTAYEREITDIESVAWEYLVQNHDAIVVDSVKLTTFGVPMQFF